jgi:pyruvate dehydrogenase E1 component alpha subunit
MASEARNRVLSAAANGKNGHSLINEAKFRQLYELALKLQMVGKRAHGDGRGLAWLRGREAALAGVAADLRDDDGLVAEPAASMAEILAGGAAFRMERRSFEERVIETLSRAVGDRMRKTGRISVIFSSGAQARGILREARAMASAARLPVLFVEDGLKAEAERPSPRRNRKNAPAASEYPTIPVDTQDVVAMYRVAHESIARAREGGGPTHIVGVRWKVKASGRTRIGASEDAVVHLERWLMARGLPAQEWRQEIVAEFEANRVERSSGALHVADNAREDDDTETRAIA